MNISQELLYLLLLYAVLADGKLNVTTALLIAFGIILLAPCLQQLCCRGNDTRSCPGSANFASLNNI
ncbi:MAG: hypothetical protein RR248_00980 [Clostridia bacterium]